MAMTIDFGRKYIDVAVMARPHDGVVYFIVSLLR
jgi:hypothetical protein